MSSSNCPCSLLSICLSVKISGFNFYLHLTVSVSLPAECRVLVCTHLLTSTVHSLITKNLAFWLFSLSLSIYLTVSLSNVWYFGRYPFSYLLSIFSIRLSLRICGFNSCLYVSYCLSVSLSYKCQLFWYISNCQFIFYPTHSLISENFQYILYPFIYLAAYQLTYLSAC